MHYFEALFYKENFDVSKSVLDLFSQGTSLAMIELHFDEELEHKTIDVVLL